ncbi:MAG: TolC family protein [Desulfovibrionaceae bacterium]
MNTRLIAAPFAALCLTISLVFSAGAALAQETEKPALPEDYLTRDWDLNACVMRGLEANPAILAARHELTGSEYDVYAALAAMLPTATASYGYTYQDRGHDDPAKVGLYDDDLWAASLNVNQPLFPGLSLLSTFQKRQLTNERAETKLTQAELNLVESIQTNFFSLLRARMDVKSAEDAVQRLQSQLQVTTAFYDVGLQPRLDVLQAEVDLASAEQSLLIARNNLAIQHAQLNTLLDFPLESDVRYVGELIQRPFSLEFKDCLERAYVRRPDIIIGQKSVEIAGKDLNIAAADMLPSFDADWDYVKRGNSADLDAGSDEWARSSQEYWTAGVTASYSIGAGKDISETLSARESYRQVRAQLETTRLDAGFEVKQAHLDIRVAADRIEVAHKQVDASREAYRMAQARYQAQVGTNTDVLDAQANLSSSEAQLNSALADYLTALSRLYVAMGERNTSLEVE